MKKIVTSRQFSGYLAYLLRDDGSHFFSMYGNTEEDARNRFVTWLKESGDEYARRLERDAAEIRKAIAALKEERP